MGSAAVSKNAVYGESGASIATEKNQSVLVSIIIPTFNEQDYIAGCLISLLRAIAGFEAEILVIDGMSTDKTRELVERYQSLHKGVVRLVDNRMTYQVHALNLGVALSRGKYIIRCDAHSIYPESYVRDILEFYDADDEQQFGNLGVSYVTKVLGKSAWSRGIALAMSSSIGVGVSHRAVGEVKTPLSVDTLLFGAWRREIFDLVGRFDPAFIRGQDYEHNLRIRQKGLRVALVPGKPFTYFTRPTLKKLLRMVHQYAYVKGQLVRKHRAAPNIRSLVPVGFFFALVLLAAVASKWSLLLLGAYMAAVAAFAIARLPENGLVAAIAMSCAVVPMHLSHAAGFVRGLISSPARQAFIQKAGHTR